MHRGRDGPEELRELLNGLDGFDGNGRRVIADLSDTDAHARAEHFENADARNRLTICEGWIDSYFATVHYLPSSKR